MSGDTKALPARNVPATPPTFRLQLRLLTPLELEQERAGASFKPHFANEEYRILWGTKSVTVDFSGAPADVLSQFHGGPVQVPLAYYGTVGKDGTIGKFAHPDGTVSEYVLDEPNGERWIEIGEYQRELPSGLSPALWALDQSYPRRHFKPLVRIPLVRFDPPPVPEKATNVELWWRLWNLGQIDESPPPSFPKDRKVGDWFVYIAKAQWNLVRARLKSKELRLTDEVLKDPDGALMGDLLFHHDRQGAPR
jgi:hypothetical protein